MRSFPPAPFTPSLLILLHFLSYPLIPFPFSSLRVCDHSPPLPLSTPFPDKLSSPPVKFLRVSPFLYPSPYLSPPSRYSPHPFLTTFTLPYFPPLSSTPLRPRVSCVRSLPFSFLLRSSNPSQTLSLPSLSPFSPSSSSTARFSSVGRK